MGPASNGRAQSQWLFSRLKPYSLSKISVISERTANSRHKHFENYEGAEIKQLCSLVFSSLCSVVCCILLNSRTVKPEERSNILISLVRISFRHVPTGLGGTCSAALLFTLGKWRENLGVPSGWKPLGQHESPHRGASLQRP